MFMYITKRTEYMGDPCRTPIWTGVGILGEPLKKRVMCLSERNDRTQLMIYGGVDLAASVVVRVYLTTLSKPPSISRNRVETFSFAFCMALVS